MSEVRSEALKRAAQADGPVTVQDLGVSRATVYKLVEEKLLKALKQTRRTGARGRPAFLFSLTAKGRRRATA